MGFVAALIPIALKLIELWLTNKANKEQAYKEFLAFVERMAPLAPVELRDSYDRQLERLKNMEVSDDRRDNPNQS